MSYQDGRLSVGLIEAIKIAGAVAVASFVLGLLA